MNAKFCATCGTALPQGVSFCPGCGTAVNTQQPAQPVVEQPAAPVAVEQPAQPVWEQPAAPVAVEQPATPVAVEQPVQPVWEQPAVPVEEPVKKSGRKWAFALIPVICLLLVGGIVFAATTVFASPQRKLAKAMERTMESGSFSYELAVECSGIDDDELAYSVVGSLLNGSIKGVAAFDDEEKTVAATAKMSVSSIDVEALLNNDGVYLYSASQGYDYGQIMEFDEDYFAKLFEKMEEQKDYSQDEAWEQFYDSLKDADIYDDFKETFDKEEFQTAVTTIVEKQMPQWEVEKDGGVAVYTMTFEVNEFLTTALETLEPAFKDGDDYDDLQDALDEMLDEAGLDTVVIGMSVTDGYWSGMSVGVKAGEVEIKLSMTMDDFGKATITADEMKDFVDRCKNADDVEETVIDSDLFGGSSETVTLAPEGESSGGTGTVTDNGTTAIGGTGTVVDTGLTTYYSEIDCYVSNSKVYPQTSASGVTTLVVPAGTTAGELLSVIKPQPNYHISLYDVDDFSISDNTVVLTSGMDFCVVNDDTSVIEVDIVINIVS